MENQIDKNHNEMDTEAINGFPIKGPVYGIQCLYTLGVLYTSMVLQADPMVVAQITFIVHSSSHSDRRVPILKIGVTTIAWLTGS